MNLNEIDLKVPQGAFSTYDMEILVPEVEKLEAGEIYLEIGVDKGKSVSVARLVAKPEVEIYGIDLKEDPFISGVHFIQGDSRKIDWLHGMISLLFIDGDHSYEGCKADIDSWYPYMKFEGVMLFHDCDESSPGVVQAVAEFVNTHTVAKWQLFKRTDRETSMSKIQL